MSWQLYLQLELRYLRLDSGSTGQSSDAHHLCKVTRRWVFSCCIYKNSMLYCILDIKLKYCTKNYHDLGSSVWVTMMDVDSKTNHLMAGPLAINLRWAHFLILVLLLYQRKVKVEKWDWDSTWALPSFMAMHVYKKGIFRYRCFNNVNLIPIELKWRFILTSREWMSFVSAPPPPTWNKQERTSAYSDWFRS